MGEERKLIYRIKAKEGQYLSTVEQEGIAMSKKNPGQLNQSMKLMRTWRRWFRWWPCCGQWLRMVDKSTTLLRVILLQESSFAPLCSCIFYDWLHTYFSIAKTDSLSGTSMMKWRWTWRGWEGKEEVKEETEPEIVPSCVYTCQHLEDSFDCSLYIFI